MESLIIQKKMGANITIPSGWNIYEQRKLASPLTWHPSSGNFTLDYEYRGTLLICKSNNPNMASYRYVEGFNYCVFTNTSGYDWSDYDIQNLPNNINDLNKAEYDGFTTSIWKIGTTNSPSRPLCVKSVQNDTSSLSRLYHATTVTVSGTERYWTVTVTYDGYYTRNTINGGDLSEIHIAPSNVYPNNGMHTINSKKVWIQKVS